MGEAGAGWGWRRLRLGLAQAEVGAGWGWRRLEGAKGSHSAAESLFCSVILSMESMQTADLWLRMGSVWVGG